MLELLVSTAILMTVSGIVATGLNKLTISQRTISNRSEMHNGVRSATELLQQEVGQAGRVVLPGIATLAGGVAAMPGAPQTVAINIDGVPSVAGIFVGEQLVVGAGDIAGVTAEETVTVSAVSAGSNEITAAFTNAHAAGEPVNAFGGFATGIVPPGLPNGSTGTVLKLYGDINGDGNMVYAEYTCDTAAGFLYRNVMPFDAAAKPAVTANQVLLDNIMANPDGTACFTYMPNPLPVVGGNSFVLDVAITLTVQTQERDPISNQRQIETKALLNVSPRNVFNVWQLASAGFAERVQPMPPTVTALLP